MKKFLNIIASFITVLFTDVDAFVASYIVPSIDIVEKIKAIISSPVGNLITALFHPETEESKKASLIDALCKAIDKMQINTDITHTTDWTGKISKLLIYLKGQSNSVRNAFYFKLASELSKQLATGVEFKGAPIDLLVSLEYTRLKSTELKAAETASIAVAVPESKTDAPDIQATLPNTTQEQFNAFMDNYLKAKSEASQG